MHGSLTANKILILLRSLPLRANKRSVKRSKKLPKRLQTDLFIQQRMLQIPWQNLLFLHHLSTLNALTSSSRTRSRNRLATLRLRHSSLTPISKIIKSASTSPPTWTVILRPLQPYLRPNLNVLATICAPLSLQTSESLPKHAMLPSCWHS